MSGFEPIWFVAGGWAIDLFLGRVTRQHDDIEIAIFRRDQLAVQKYLDKWVLKKAENNLLSSWKQGEFLKLPVHTIHCFNAQAEPPFFEILLNEFDDNTWIFRRDKMITKPFSELFLTSQSGIKFLCPEVVLLYKSKNPRTKDEQDFRNTVERLDEKTIAWLRAALAVCDPENSWLQKL